MTFNKKLLTVAFVATIASSALVSTVEARCNEGDQIVQTAEDGRRQIAAELQKLEEVISALEQLVGADHDTVRKLGADYERLQQQANNLIQEAEKNAKEVCTDLLNGTAERIEREVSRIAGDVEEEINRTAERIEREVNRIAEDVEEEINRTAERIEREVNRTTERIAAEAKRVERRFKKIFGL